MKKALLILAIAFSLLVLSATASMAAPSVSLKVGAGAGLAGVEVGFPIGESWAVIVEGGWVPGGFTGGVGGRYYFSPEGWRWFITGYATVQYAETTEGTVFAPIFIANGGIEYLSPGGFRLAAEAGIQLIIIVPFPSIGFSVGYQF